VPVYGGRLLIGYLRSILKGLGAIRNVETWWSDEQPFSVARRVWRRVVNRTVRRFYVQGDALGRVFKRMAAFLLGWGCAIGLLTWAGYRNGTLHGVGDGVLSVVVLFALALLFSAGYLGSRPE
jgi:hypothetical protein